jgi:hypothetical protein
MGVFDRLIMVDWSAASAPGPVRPSANRCWVGRLDPHEADPVVVYCRTRHAALDQIARWRREAGKASVLIGFDFPFGYPDGCRLPGGRQLCDWLVAWLVDGPDDRNNRFALAAQINRELCLDGEGPFWGHPLSARHEGLAQTRPNPWPTAIPEFRKVEAGLKRIGIQSVWKLAYPASVGSQILTGMAAIGRLLEQPGFGEARLWPFETDWETGLGQVTIAEIWPNLFYPAWRADPRVARHAIRDAQQVAATLLALRTADLEGRIGAMLGAPSDCPADALASVVQQEGWIVGASLVR